MRIFSTGKLHENQKKVRARGRESAHIQERLFSRLDKRERERERVNE